MDMPSISNDSIGRASGTFDSIDFRKDDKDEEADKAYGGVYKSVLQHLKHRSAVAKVISLCNIPSAKPGQALDFSSWSLIGNDSDGLMYAPREESHPTIDPISLQNSFVRLKLKTPSTGFTRCICTPDFFIYSSSHKDPNKTELFYLHLPIRQFQTRLDGPKARSYLTVLDSTNPHRVSTKLVVFTFVFSV
ncbi:hypothetical protein TWF128_007063 [Orbilia oligospora]|nr:hypothetical protein TWF128_007063 [Orbilia oligospora]